MAKKRLKTILYCIRFVASISVFVLLCLLLSLKVSYADIVYFKKGGSIEGVVTEEDGTITIDVGYGSITVSKNDVERIEKASEERQRWLKDKSLKLSIERGEWAPEKYKDINKRYIDVMNTRQQLSVVRSENKNIDRQITLAERSFHKLLIELDKKGKELMSVDADKEIKKYNEIVVKINSMKFSISEVRNKIKNLYERKKKAENNLSKVITSYYKNYLALKGLFDRTLNNPKSEPTTKEEIVYLDVIKGKLHLLEKDFSQDITNCTFKEGSIWVNVVLNNKLVAKLILDTGASVVSITKRVAEKLGIEYKKINMKIKVALADGSESEATPIILDTVKVGHSELKGVRAAVLEVDSLGGADGLLGMSFLGHFIVNMDTVSNKLILHKISD